MDSIFTIYKKEMRSYFTSPVAYIVIVVFLIITGWFFTSNLFIGGAVTMRGVLDIIPFILIFFIPAISMRTFAEEKKTGTIELLLTKPITDFDIIFAKFLSTLSFAALALAPTIIYVISLSFLGSLDYGSIISAYIGLILMSGVLVSIGIFASSLTENQVIAFIVCFLIVFALFMLNKILIYMPTGIVSILEYISTDYHFGSISRGVIDSRDIIYYLSGIAIMMFFTKTSLERRKWRVRKVIFIFKIGFFSNKLFRNFFAVADHGHLFKNEEVPRGDAPEPRGFIPAARGESGGSTLSRPESWVPTGELPPARTFALQPEFIEILEIKIPAQYRSL